jgi:hypothetical protein
MRNTTALPLGIDLGGEAHFSAVHLGVQLLAHVVHHQQRRGLLAARRLLAGDGALLDAGQVAQALVQQGLVQRGESSAVPGQSTQCADTEREIEIDRVREIELGN